MGALPLQHGFLRQLKALLLQRCNSINRSQANYRSLFLARECMVLLCLSILLQVDCPPARCSAQPRP